MSRQIFSFRKILFLSLSTIALFFILFSGKYIPVLFKGISLWATCVLPSVFPFFFLTSLFTQANIPQALSQRFSRFFSKLPGLDEASGSVFCISVLSGYPVGAKMISDLTENGLLTKNQAISASLSCSTAGPLFLLGTVGSVFFSSQRAGFLLLISHLTATLLSAALLRKKVATRACGRAEPFKKAERTGDLLYSGMLSSVLSVLCTGGFIAVFYLLSQMLSDVLAKISFLGGQKFLLPVLCGLVEMTGGCQELSKIDSVFSLPLCALLVTFGGASVLLQQIAYLQKAEIPIGRFLLGKCVSALLAFLFCLLGNVISKLPAI